MAIFGEADYIIGGVDKLTPVIKKNEADLAKLANQVAAVNRQLGNLTPPKDFSAGLNLGTQRLEAMRKELGQVKTGVDQAFGVKDLNQFKESTLEVDAALRKVGQSTREVLALEQKLGENRQAIVQNATKAIPLGPVGGGGGGGVPPTPPIQEATDALKELTDEQEKTDESGFHLGNTFKNLDQSLGKFGLSTRSISVLLGAGFAGGLAGIIRVGEKVGRALVDMANKELDLQHQTDLTFGNAADSVEHFANVVAERTGRTRQEIQGLAIDFAALGRSLDIPEDSLTKFSEFLAQASADLVGRIPGVKTVQDAQKLITDAINGQEDALKKLGLTFDELDDISERVFGRHLDRLSEIEKANLALIVIGDVQAKKQLEQGEKNVGPWERLKKVIADATGAVVSFWAESPDERFTRISGQLDALGNAILDFGVTAASGSGQRKFADEIHNTAIELSDLEKLLAQAQKDGDDKVIPVIEREIAARKRSSAAVDKQSESILTQNQILQQNIDKFLRSTDAQNQLADIELQHARAVRDNAQTIIKAEDDSFRVTQDNAKRERDVRLQNQRSLEDANKRIGDANIRLQRAREDAAQKLEDFTVEHDRKIQDLNREHQRKLEDFAIREKNTRDESAKNTLEALVKVQNAQFDFNTRAFNEAQRALAAAGIGNKKSNDDLALDKKRELEDFDRNSKREQEDRIRELGKLEVETNRAIFDSKEAVTQALLERQRAEEDAFNKLNDLEIENNRAEVDAERRLAAAHQQAADEIEDHDKALQRLVEQYHITLDALERILVAQEIWNKLASENINPGLQFAQVGKIFAAGGFLASGDVGIAGERGRELIFGGKTGSTILPNDLTEAIFRILNGGAGPNITVNQVANDPEATAFAVWARSLSSVNN